MGSKPTHEELEQRVKELEEPVEPRRTEEPIEQLNLLKEQLLGPGTLKERLKRITDSVVENFDADFCRIWITKPGDLCDSGCFHAGVTEGPHVCHYRERCLHLMASSGRYIHIDGGHGRVPFGCYKIGRVASGEDLKFITNDVTHDPRVHDHDWATRLGLVSFAGYRLLSADGMPIGVLALFSKYVISPHDDALLEGLANTTAQVIHTAMTDEALRKALDELEKRIEERTVELVKTNDELKQEIEERKRIEAELLEKQEALRAQNITTVRKSIELSDIKRELEDRNYDLELSSAELEKAMEALRKARDELELRVEERTRELAKANEELQAEINERKQAEEALAESEEKYRTQFEQALDAIFIADAETGILLDCNHAGLELVGRAESELVGKHQSILHPPEELEGEFSRTFKQHLEEKEGQPLEAQVIAKNGEIRDVSIKANILELKGRKILQGMFRDITDQKRMEKEKEKLEAHLRRAEKMKALGTLAGGVAHDLNNILSGLVTYPELLLLDLAEDSPLRRPILTIQNSGKKAAAIVQDLLTLARRGVAGTEVVNINDIISDYFRSPEHEKLKSFHRSVRFATNLETDLLNTLGSSLHLSKTVMNLVSNAAEALLDGGAVTISTRSQYIDKPIRGYDEIREGDYIVLTVADNGIGISAEDLERIFEPFYTKKVMGRSGTGLGMAVVWGTVKDHNGYIDVHSTVGKGTTFDLYFPVTRKEAKQGKTDTSIEEYMGHGEKILVVDDVQEQREIASVLLSKLGYSVNVVSSGEEAVDHMKTNSADLLVLDMIMDPGIDGLETYQRILELRPGQKAIIASGFSETDRVKEAQRLGVGRYIKKPYTLEKVGLTVKREIEK
jgi:two-component system cell cycle sensor histidine kinase/response regulator CckA